MFWRVQLHQQFEQAVDRAKIVIDVGLEARIHDHEARLVEENVGTVLDFHNVRMFGDRPIGKKTLRLRPVDRTFAPQGTPVGVRSAGDKTLGRHQIVVIDNPRTRQW